MRTYLVQCGILGAVGRFRSVDSRSFERNQEVVCRTSRGLEVGRVLACDGVQTGTDTDGRVLRQVTPEDRLIIDRIDRYRDRAFEACAKLIRDRNLDATLVDVEHLFDGQGLYFYFLGDVTPELESLTDELGETYEAKVRFRKFTETLVNGCGPDCGTGEGCSSNGCNNCALSGGCRTSDS